MHFNILNEIGNTYVVLPDVLLHIIPNAMKALAATLYGIFGICLDGACANLDGLFLKIYYS